MTNKKKNKKKNEPPTLRMCKWGFDGKLKGYHN